VAIHLCYLAPDFELGPVHEQLPARACERLEHAVIAGHVAARQVVLATSSIAFPESDIADRAGRVAVR
jgi:hypothetical protein